MYAKEGANALRPIKSIGYCFRLDNEANKIGVRRSDEEGKYVPDGFVRLMHGDIVPNLRLSRKRKRGTEDVAEENHHSKKPKQERSRQWQPQKKRPWIRPLDIGRNAESLKKYSIDENDLGRPYRF